jgi:release factor glutamine methyltransferase
VTITAKPPLPDPPPHSASKDARERAYAGEGREWTIDAMRRQLAQEFRQAGIDSPELDARLLVGHALGLDHAALVAQSRRVLTTVEADAIAALARRRLAREPVARIIGHKEFWGLSFKLNADTLLPRPETETVVEAALATIGEDRRAHPLRIADLGTGSGALLLALLSELPAACGVGTDISTRALECARDNAAALGFASRASFVACDYGTALKGSIDLIVCNPPYVLQGDLAALAPEVRDFDPRRALDGGPDGLGGYRAVAADSLRLLAPDGAIVVELGFGQAGPASAILAAAGLAPAPPKHDLSGIARALVARILP